MDTLSSNTKRKKRKTRKCLDDIRKRSRRNTNGSGDTLENNHLVGKISETVTNLNSARPKNCITSNRLTLAMFPKAIRSETITRPIVPDFIQNPIKIVKINIVKDGRPQSTVTSSSLKNKDVSYSDVIKNSDEESVNSVCDKRNKMGIQRDSGSEKVGHREHSAGSFILFSPTDQPAHADVIDESPNGETVSTLTTPTSQSSREGYHLYEEFMNEIPAYFKKMAPALFKDDVMKKTRTYLHNIYMEGCRRECEDNILQCIKKSIVTQHGSITPCVALSQNSMDFIKVDYSWGQTVSQELNGSVDATSRSVTPASPMVSPSSSTCTHGAARSLIHDTPEYIYYPHKLNQ